MAALFRLILQKLVAAVGRLEKSTDPKISIERLRAYRPGWRDIASYSCLIILALFSLYIMEVPSFPKKLAIPILYILALLLPITSQFFVPATPIFSWLLTFYSSRFIPVEYRPTIHVALLPTLETVLYGANISDILTRFTHPVFDIIAWLPYGVIHFTFPFVVAVLLWLFVPAQKNALPFWASAFGYMNLLGVLVQIMLPCAAPWYELIYGLTPANYSIPGHPGGLARIDAIFHSNGYKIAFGSAPIAFGAFPSLHAGCATIEMLFMSHFFAQYRPFFWTYAMVLYWATMYLTHHYLIDVVAGACLSVACFYFFLPDDLKDYDHDIQQASSGLNGYDRYDLESSARSRFRAGTWAERGSEGDSDDFDLASDQGGGTTPTSAIPLLPRRATGPRAHRQTSSIASLTGPNQLDDTWGSTPSRSARAEEGTP